MARLLRWPAALLALSAGCITETESGGVAAATSPASSAPTELRQAAVTSVQGTGLIPVAGTYAWVRESRVVAEDPRVDRGLVHAAVRTDLQEALARHNLRPGGLGAVDLWVGYVVALERDVDAEAVGRLIELESDVAPPAEGYERGMLILEVVDARRERLAWRGAIQADADLDLPADVRRERLRLAVDSLVAHMMRGR